MGTLALLVLAVALPTGTGYAIVAARAGHRRYLASRPALPETASVERMWRDLRRLHDQLAEIENAPSDMPAKNQRCRATRAAYLDVLGAACRLFGVTAPSGRPVPDAEIYRVEADLRLHGVDVRPVA